MRVLYCLIFGENLSTNKLLTYVGMIDGHVAESSHSPSGSTTITNSFRAAVNDPLLSYPRKCARSFRNLLKRRRHENSNEPSAFWCLAPLRARAPLLLAFASPSADV